MSHTLLVQLSDTHIREPGRLAYGRLDTAPYLRQAVNAIRNLPQKPTAIVMTGDLTDFGRAAEYEHLRTLLSPLAIPIYLLPGNHDDRQQMRSSFPDHAYLGTDGFVQYSVSIGELQLITLDTVVPNESKGSLCEKRLAWLSIELDKNKNRPVVVAMHHPPFKTLIGHMDDIGLMNGAPELEALVKQYSNVQRVICGHLHRSIQVNFGSAIALTVPSPAHQVCLDLSPDAKSAWVLEPPGFGIHTLPRDGRMVSHTAYCGAFDGPYPFHEPSGQLID
jgi:3',5'-cyclic AMP phosphodiesterase CpdA